MNVPSLTDGQKQATTRRGALVVCARVTTERENLAARIAGTRVKRLRTAAPQGPGPSFRPTCLHTAGSKARKSLADPDAPSSVSLTQVTEL